MLGPERRGVVLPGAGGSGVARRLAGWVVLAVLLASVLAGVVMDDAAATPPAGDGTTWWMQASSLAHDLDLTYGPRDYERFEAVWGVPPEGLRLRSRDAGEHIAYDVAVPYAVALAPLVRLAPVRGPALASALFLILSSLAAAAVLERRLGPTAPLYVAVCVFASVVFTYTFRPGPELFCLAAVVGAFALALRGEGPAARALSQIYSGALPGEEPGRGPVRWIVVGALLALAGAHHPVYLVLALPLALAPPFGRRRLGASVLALALVAVWGMAAAAGWAAGDDWLPWSERGRVFLAETGFPAVDTPVAAWPERPPEEALRWLPGDAPEPVLDGALWAWNLLFVLVGRAFGVVPYFLPLILALAALPGAPGAGAGRARAAIPWVVALVMALFPLVRPFDFAGDLSGGPTGPANPLFVPLYGALWFVAARPLRPLPILAVALVATPFLFPSWLAPRSVAQAEALRDGAYVSPVAARILPHESTQRGVPGVREIQHGVLWIRSLGPGIVAAGEEDLLRIDVVRGGELLVASPVPLAGLRLGLGTGAPTQADLVDAKLVRTTLTPGGGVILEVDPGAPDRTHPLWWTRGDVFLYRLGLAFPAPAAGGEGVVPLEVIPVYQGEGAGETAGRTGDQEARIGGTDERRHRAAQLDRGGPAPPGVAAAAADSAGRPPPGGGVGAAVRGGAGAVDGAHRAVGGPATPQEPDRLSRWRAGAGRGHLGDGSPGGSGGDRVA